MADRYDAIVVGLGGMGSATAFHLARRGARVLGLERFDVIHPFGSSHGLNRIIRLAYSEHPSYVPLLRRAYELWHELENLDGRQLLSTTGILEGGLAGGETFTGALRAAELHDLPHEVLTGAEVNGPCPAYRPPDEHRRSSTNRTAGSWPARKPMLAHVRQALARGARPALARPARGVGAHSGERVRVRAGGAAYEADRLVLAAGAWSSKLVPRLEGLAVPERQVLAWLATTRPEVFGWGRCRSSTSRSTRATTTASPSGASRGSSSVGTTTCGRRPIPTRWTGSPPPATRRSCARSPAATSPTARAPPIMLKACLFTNSPDEHFIIDRLPEHPQVSIAAGFSGHGYKFCSVVGEIMAELSLEGATRHDLRLFGLDRLSG